jgi:FkbM family methyltransferase
MNTATAPQLETVEAQLARPYGLPLAFRLFKTDSCFKIAHDILAGTTYPHVHFVDGVKTVLDIGANLGAASAYFAQLYPHARVYAFEPASAPFSLLKFNTVSFPNVVAFPFGFFAHDKQAPLYHGKADPVESSVIPSHRTDSNCEQIQLVSAPKFLAEQSITKVDILKLDTEGCEVPVLRSLKNYLPEVKLLYVEYHSDRDRRLIDELMAETHILWRGHVPLAYRGEFCYLNRRLIPSETYTSEILLPLD